MPIVILSQDENVTKLGIGPSLDVEFFSGVAESGVSSDTTFFILEVESDGPSTDATVAQAVEADGPSTDADLDYSFGHLVDADIVSPWNTPQKTDKFVVFGSRMDHQKVYYADIPDNFELTAPEPFDNIEGFMDANRGINLPGQASENRSFQTPDGRVVTLSYHDDSVKITDNVGRELQFYTMTPGTLSRAVSVAVNDSYIYILNWVHVPKDNDYWYTTSDGRQELRIFYDSIEDFNSCGYPVLDDRYAIEQRYLTTGELVEFEWESAISTDTFFPENDYFLELDSFINTGAPWVSTDVVFSTDRFVLADIELDAINNNLGTDLEFASDDVLFTDTELLPHDSVSTDVEFFTATTVSEYMLLDTELVTWEYAQTYAFIDAEPELQVLHAIETDAQLESDDAYVKVDAELMTYEMISSTFQFQGATVGTWGIHCDTTRHTEIDHHKISILDPPYFMKSVARKNFDFGQTMEVEDDGWAEYVPNVRAKWKSYANADWFYSEYNAQLKKPVIDDFRNVQNVVLLATNTKLVLVHNKTIPYNSTASDNRPYIFRLAEPETSADKRNTWSYIAEYDPITKWPTGVAKQINNMSCRYGVHLTDNYLAMVEIVAYTDGTEPPPWVDGTGNCWNPDLGEFNVDMVCYDSDYNLVFNKDAIIPAYTGSTSINELCIDRGIRQEGSVRVTNIGVLCYAWTEADNTGVELLHYKESYRSRHILFPFWNPDDPITFRNMDASNLMYAEMLEFPNYVESDASLLAQGNSWLDADSSLVGTALHGMSADLEFTTDDSLLLDCDLEDRNYGVCCDVLLGHVGYREEVSIITQSGLGVHRTGPNGHRRLDLELEQGLPNQRFNLYTQYPGTYSLNCEVWTLGKVDKKHWHYNSTEHPDVPGIDEVRDNIWVVEENMSPFKSFGDSLLNDVFVAMDNVPPLPIHYEVDNDTSVIFGFYNKYDDDTHYIKGWHQLDHEDEHNNGQPTEEQVPAQSAAGGVLYRLDDVHAPFTSWVNLPERLVSSFGNESFYTYRKFGIDKTNKKIYVIRAKGGLDFTGFHNTTFYRINGGNSGYPLYSWVAGTRVGYPNNLLFEYFNHSVEEIRLLGDTALDTVPHRRNEYTDRDILVYDYDLNQKSVIKSIRGLQEDDVIVHLYEKNGTFYILTQVKSPATFDMEEALGAFWSDIGVVTGDASAYMYGNYTYNATRMYTLTGDLASGLATELYSFDHAGNSLDSMMIQEVTDTHIWINWDGVSLSTSRPFNGVGLKLDGSGMVEAPNMLAVIEVNGEWELIVREAMENQDTDQFRWNEWNGLSTNYNDDRLPKYFARHGAVGVPDNMKYTCEEIPYTYIDYDTGLPVETGKEVDVYNEPFRVHDETTLKFKRTHWAAGISCTQRFGPSTLSYYTRQGSPYPAVSRVFRKRVYDWVYTDCNLKEDVTLAPPATWVDITNGGPEVIEV